MKLLSSTSTLVDGSSTGELYIKHEQFITDELLDDCRTKRDASMSQPMGEMHQIASIPVGVYETWLRKGFDPMRSNAREILARLTKEGLDAFKTTNRVL